MTKEKAIEVLEKDVKEPVEHKTIKVQAADKSIEIKYSDLSPEYNIDETVNEAMNYGKDLNLFEKNNLINGKGRLRMASGRKKRTSFPVLKASRIKVEDISTKGASTFFM